MPLNTVVGKGAAIVGLEEHHTAEQVLQVLMEMQTRVCCNIEDGTKQG